MSTLTKPNQTKSSQSQPTHPYRKQIHTKNRPDPVNSTSQNWSAVYFF